MAVELHWEDAADIGAVNVIKIRYDSGQDTYHVRNLRVVIDSDPPRYGTYPEGFPYDASSAAGSNPNLGEGYDSGSVGDATQWSVEDGAYVASGSFVTFNFPYSAWGTSVTLYWDHAADIGSSPVGETSTGRIDVNGSFVGTFTTPSNAVGWGSVSADITAHWNGAGAGDTSTAELLVNGASQGTFTTDTAQNGWTGQVADITADWVLDGDNLVRIVYDSGPDTYHVRNLQVIIDGGTPDLGEFPDGFPYDAITANPPFTPDLGQGYDGVGQPRQFSNQTDQFEVGSTYLEWFFGGVVGWLINAVAMQ